jgi:hypothetical protein
MGKTCRILSDDRVFNALETIVHQHVATVIRTRYDMAKEAGTHTRILTFLIDRYNKHKEKPFENRVFDNYKDAKDYFLETRQDYDLINPPRQIPSTNNYEVYSYSGKQYASIINGLTGILKEVLNEEETKFLEEDKLRRQAANEAFNDEGELYSPESDVDFSVSIESQYDFVLRRKKEEMTNLNRLIALEEARRNAENVEILTKAKEKLEEDIQKLADTPNFSDIMNIASSDLEDIDTILDKDVLSPQDLTIVQRKLEFWLSDRFKDAFFSSDDVINEAPNYKNFLAKKAQFARNRARWEDLASAYMNSVIKDVTNNNYTEAELMIMKKQLLEINIGQGQMRDLSTDSNIFIQVIDTKMKEASELARQEVLEFQKKLTIETEALIKRVGSNDPKKLYELFLQLDSKGNWSGNIVYRFSQSFFDSKQAIEVTDWSNVVQVKAMYKWLKDNTITFDPRKLFYEDYLEMEEGNHPIIFGEADREAHIAELKRHLGEKGFASYFENQKNVFRDFKARYNEVKENLEASPSTEEEIKDALEAWKKEWSPFYYLDKTTGSSTSAGKFLGYNYIVNVPRRFKSDGEVTGWYDKNFDKIEADPAYLRYYEFLTNSLQKFKVYYPSENKLQVNYLPELRETQILKQFFTNPLALKSNLYDFFIDQTAENEIFQDQTDSMGNLIRVLPAHMMSNAMSKLSAVEKRIIVDEAAKKIPNTNSVEFKTLLQKMQYDAIQKKLKEKSFDLFKVLSAHAVTAETFKHKTRTEDFLRIAKDFVYNAERINVTANGQASSSIMGFNTQKDGLRNLINAVDYAFDSWYGLDKNKKAGKLLAKDLESKKKIEAYEVDLKELESQPQDDETIKKIELLKENIRSLQKIFVTSNAADTVLKYIHIKSMGWNPFSAVTNLGFGFISNYTHAAGEQDFTSEELNKAYSYLLNNVFRSTRLVNMKTAVKISQLMMEYGVVGDIREGTNSHAIKGIREKFKVLLPYEMTSRAEFVNQGSTFIAMMLNTKNIKDLANKDRTLFEAYTLDADNNLIWNEAEFGPQEAWQSLGKSKTAFKLKVEAVKKIIHGNYDPNSPVAIKKTALGRALMMFRNWVAEGFANRFESEYENIKLGRQVKGRYTSFYTAKTKAGDPVGIGRSISLTLQEMARILTRGMYNSKGVNVLTDVDKANLKKNAMELNIYLSLLVLTIILKHLHDDDDDDESAIFLTFMINNFNRLQTDISFYTSPLSFEKLQRNSIPAFGFITDIARLNKAAYRYISGNDGRNGSTTFQEAFFRVFPMGFAYYRTESILEDVQE